VIISKHGKIAACAALHFRISSAEAFGFVSTEQRRAIAAIKIDVYTVKSSACRLGACHYTNKRRSAGKNSRDHEFVVLGHM